MAEIGRFYGGMGVSTVSRTAPRLESQRQGDKPLDRQLAPIEEKMKMENV
jgi:hypothetical protein